MQFLSHSYFLCVFEIWIHFYNHVSFIFYSEDKQKSFSLLLILNSVGVFFFFFFLILWDPEKESPKFISFVLFLFLFYFSKGIFPGKIFVS